MKSFATSMVIQATPEVVWSVLTDAPNWPSWNTTIERIEGTIAPGEKITIHTKAAPDHGLPVKVSGFVPGSRMVWTGGMTLGLFVGERTFSLSDKGDGSVEFTMRVVYKGLLAPFFERSLPDMQETFDEFAAALKRHCEGMA